MAILVVAFSVLLVGCGFNEESTEEPLDSQELTADIEIVMDDMRFEPNVIRGEAGETIDILLRNPDSVVHDLTIDDLDGERIHEEVRPNAVEILTITLPDEPGEWAVYCSVPGHRQLGMEGVIEVTD